MNVYDWYITPEEYKQAKDNGISCRNLERRIRVYAWDKKRAINTPVKKLNKIGKSNIEKAKNNGINYLTLKSRLNNGWSMEKATTEPLTNMSELYTNIGKNNKKYPAWVYQNLKKNSISLNTFYKRIQQNKWTLEEACTKPVMTKRQAAILGAEAYHKKYGNKFGAY